MYKANTTLSHQPTHEPLYSVIANNVAAYTAPPTLAASNTASHYYQEIENDRGGAAATYEPPFLPQLQQGSILMFISN